MFELYHILMDLLATSKLLFRPPFWRWGTIIYIDFSMFTSRPPSLLACNRTFTIFFMVLRFHSLHYNYQHRLRADVVQSVPFLTGFLGTSWWHNVMQSWNVMAITHLLVWDLSEKEMYDTDFYLRELHCSFRLNKF